MTRELELRLMGHAAGDGEMLAGDAVAVIGAVRELAYRVTRAVNDREGLGRADAMVERLAEVRVALRGQGARLVFSIGDPDAFDIDPNAAEVDDQLWRILKAMASNTRPAGVSDSVAEPVDQLVVALWKAATGVECVAARRKPLVLTTRTLDRRPWQRSTPTVTTATMTGVLEMVDLRSDRFRLREADGTVVDLLEVPDAPLLAHLVGRRVAATGVLARGSATRHHRMEGATVALPRPVEESVRILPGQATFDFDAHAPATAPTPASAAESSPTKQPPAEAPAREEGMLLLDL